MQLKPQINVSECVLLHSEEQKGLCGVAVQSYISDCLCMFVSLHHSVVLSAYEYNCC